MWSLAFALDLSLGPCLKVKDINKSKSQMEQHEAKRFHHSEIKLHEKEKTAYCMELDICTS